MSDPVSALSGAASQGIARVTEQGPRGMLTLRGSLTSQPIAKAVRTATGLDVPGVREVALKGDMGVAWMSPDELLVLLPHGEATAAAAAMAKALKGEHTLVAEVSDARAVFRFAGPYAREVLAKLAPVDLHPDRFKKGMIRRTHLAQVPAAFWLVSDDTFEIMCFRSVAQYVFDLLSTAAADGSEVGIY